MAVAEPTPIASAKPTRNATALAFFQERQGRSRDGGMTNHLIAEQRESVLDGQVARLFRDRCRARGRPDNPLWSILYSGIHNGNNPGSSRFQTIARYRRCGPPHEIESLRADS